MGEIPRIKKAWLQDIVDTLAQSMAEYAASSSIREEFKQTLEDGNLQPLADAMNTKAMSLQKLYAINSSADTLVDWYHKSGITADTMINRAVHHYEEDDCDIEDIVPDYILIVDDSELTKWDGIITNHNTLYFLDSKTSKFYELNKGDLMAMPTDTATTERLKKYVAYLKENGYGKEDEE